MTGMPTLESPRLIIRQLTLDDLDDIARVLDDAFGHTPIEERRRWLEWTVRNYVELAALYQPPYGERAIIRRDDQRLIGSVGVVPCLMPFGQMPSWGGKRSLVTPEVGLFWAVESPYRGQGCATEAAQAVIDYAFREIRIQRIVATTQYENSASQAVMRRLGMTVERNPFPDPPWLQVVGRLDNPRQPGL